MPKYDKRRKYVCKICGRTNRETPFVMTTTTSIVYISNLCQRCKGKQYYVTKELRMKPKVSIREQILQYFNTNY